MVVRIKPVDLKVLVGLVGLQEVVLEVPVPVLVAPAVVLALDISVVAALKVEPQEKQAEVAVEPQVILEV
jgi:hypothetical protein